MVSSSLLLYSDEYCQGDKITFTFLLFSVSNGIALHALWLLARSLID